MRFNLETVYMKSVSTKLLATICASMLLTACATTRSPLTPQQVTTLLTTMPAETTNDRDATAKQFLRGGEAAIVDLFHKVVPTGDGDDTAVRTALNGIAKYASRPGAEKQRKTFENAALTALPTLASDEAKAFTIRQLEVAGGDASVTVLADLLRDAALAQPSITVLQIIATPKAKASIHSALGNTDSAKINAALIKALGELRNDTSNQKITKYAASNNRDLRYAALYALANIADPSSETVLESAVRSSKGYNQIEAKSLLALYQRRRAE